MLYLACKSGFYDTSKRLLEKGASINETQADGSTALHAAAYYGHKLVVELLLEYGAATNIKNRFGHTALEESRTDEIKRLIQTASTDSISSLAAQLREKGLVKSVRFVEYQGEVVEKELVRDPESLDACTRAKWDEISQSWECVWHGTRYENLLSIFKNGLLPSGSNGIKPPDGHIPLNIEKDGIKNWAAAIFVSPSMRYAAAYSQQVESKSNKWCVLVKAHCKPESYKSCGSTLSPPYEPINGEPTMLEYRVPFLGKDKNVKVQSVLFVRSSFLKWKSIEAKQRRPE